jgi:hypothetical protein
MPEQDTTSKYCPACDRTLPPSRFYRDRSRHDGLNCICKECEREKTRFKNTGWSKDRFLEAWKDQEGQCAICSVDLVDGGHSGDSVHADHCHETGKIRELLCSFCNRAIGLLRDDPELIRKAADYVQRFK